MLIMIIVLLINPRWNIIITVALRQTLWWRGTCSLETAGQQLTAFGRKRERLVPAGGGPEHPQGRRDDAVTRSLPPPHTHTNVGATIISIGCDSIPSVLFFPQPEKNATTFSRLFNFSKFSKLENWRADPFLDSVCSQVKLRALTLSRSFSTT